ncbi:proteasome beta subunit [Halodesulfurarchaeum formicicum]|uniref:Proteasome subunit beta n=1 Tax=Halodesulfurarchaeum formicicum TaxID=1873524 RepID=A0A1D8S5S0_9EURY|nr:archaeal proteasome endopeptidase complex subunit beta [Halodesulfurarchaeum formicicum]AOW80700.1 proteasome beta subunit [Halodesulfurarchaeum formicicum]APE96038.1 proteasome beta subunit [Halodesulfurarchaeum formicicum]
MNVEDPYEPELGSLPEWESAGGDTKHTETGTTSIGVTTADSVVIATDRRASLGGRVVSNKNVTKVEQVHDTAALTMVGSVGGAQSFIRSIRAEANLYEARRDKPMKIDALATLASNFLRGGPFFMINPILGGVDDTGPHVYSIDPAGGLSEDEYVVTGSGMQFAMGVLEQEYREDLSHEEGIEIAARAVQSASERDTASGNGITIAEVTTEGVEIHEHEDIDDVLGGA